MRTNIKLDKKPKEDIKNGLVVRFLNIRFDGNSTETETEWVFADINKGQQEYELPFSEGRNIMGVFQKIL